jgi:hypothetical protein
MYEPPPKSYRLLLVEQGLSEPLSYYRKEATWYTMVAVS